MTGWVEKDLKRFPNRPWATLPQRKVHGIGLNNTHESQSPKEVSLLSLFILLVLLLLLVRLPGCRRRGILVIAPWPLATTGRLAVRVRSGLRLKLKELL